MNKDKEKLYNYLKNIYNKDTMSYLTEKHINEYLEEGFSYKRILALVHYCYAVNDEITFPSEKYGLRILLNYYPDMVKYYQKENERIKRNKGKKNHKKTIKIDDSFFLENSYRNSLQIDMEDL